MALKIRKLLIIIILLTSATCSSGPSSFPRTIEAHKECPLCGMLPARYPRFHCQIIFNNGTYEAFDSAAGLLVYLLFPEKTGMVLKKIDHIYFKDYVNEIWIESSRTYLVFGSDVMGPMGVELLPVDSMEMARNLSKRENGQEILHFDQIDRTTLINAAEKGWLHTLAKKLVLE